jgi:putative oxidoreductase
MKLRDWLLPIESPPAVFLIRLATGGVFLSEGIQKFLFPAALGAGRFARIGIPAPQFMGPFVGVVEIVCGSLLLLGLLTRLAALPLVIDMVVALLQTKFPFWLEHGFWAAAHESRTDIAMLLGSLFLLAVGPGPISFDALFVGRPERESSPGFSRR